ncbi:MAG: carboxymuconolactone decarboxylase family protein [Caulobacteraceae bacterium]
MDEDTGGRFARGWETVGKINAPARDRQMQALWPLAPDFARWIVEAGYGDILSRPGLGLREREIATVAALTALGNAPAQLKAHIEGALNVGLTREEIVEVIVQMAIYAGVPAAINALAAAREVFEARAPSR